MRAQRENAFTPPAATAAMFRNNQNGAFSSAANSTADIVIEESDFVGNSTDSGSHSVYLSGGKSATLRNIHDYGSTWGNDQKSRIATVTSIGGFYKSIQ